MASASSISFSCQHVTLATHPSLPISQCNLDVHKIQTYKCDNLTKDTLTSISPPENFHHVVQLSHSCNAVFTYPNTTCPTGYTWHIQYSDEVWQCKSRSCNKKSGTAKQLKTKPICLHLHLLFCHLQLSSSNSSPFTIPSLSTPQEPPEISVTRKSSVELNMKHSIPYPLPSTYIQACRSMDNSSTWPNLFCPSDLNCKLCGALLSVPRRHPGQNTNYVQYLITPGCIFKPIDIKVKLCTNVQCHAMHQVWPVDQGIVCSLTKFSFHTYI